jgi:hypothetical protein
VKGGLVEVTRHLLDDLKGVVTAPVEDQDHLVAAGGNVELVAERLQAGCYVRRLIACGYDDNRLQVWVRACLHGVVDERLQHVGFRRLDVHSGLSPATISWRPCSR